MLDYKLRAYGGDSMTISYYDVEERGDDPSEKDYKDFSSNYIGKIIYFLENERTIYTRFIFIADHYRGKGIMGKMFSIMYSLNPNIKIVSLNVKEELLRKGKLVKHYGNLGFETIPDTERNIKLGNMTYRMLGMKKELTEKDFDTNLFFHNHNHF
jgi:hypothetical protein